jgi:hypothetical protein
MYVRPARTVAGLIAVGGAITVGVITHDAGFTALTFLGGLMLPRILGLRTHRHGWGGPPWARGVEGGPGGRHGIEQRLDAWHRRAHEGTGGEQPPVAGAAGA